MKVRIPKHREFLIKFEDGYDKEAEAWDALNQIVKDYSVDGKSVYTKTFIEDNEEKVKALQEKYEFTYEIIEKVRTALWKRKKLMLFLPLILTRYGDGQSAKQLTNLYLTHLLKTLILLKNTRTISSILKVLTGMK